MPGIRAHRRILAALTGLVVAGTSTCPTLAQESASFRMERVTTSATAATASSTSFGMDVTFGQEVPVGSASRCNLGFVQNLGFWSVLGRSDSNIRLTVTHGATPAEVALEWTGSSDAFTVYRSDLPGMIAAPANVALTTTECAAADLPPEAPIAYYVVLPANAP